jgi:two-component system, sensor histidine kinase and response regulator
VENPPVDGEHFDLVLVDQQMSEMSGTAFIEQMLDGSEFDGRIVLMEVAGDRAECGANIAGRYSSLRLPVRRDELSSTIRSFTDGTAAPAVMAETVDPVQRRGSGTKQCRLLLAEDNLVNQKVAVAMLSNAGYRVDVVSDGAKAVLASAAEAYDAILMDCQMPEMNGYEATAAIRHREGSERRTPIIAITAGARAEDETRCFAEGMDGYLAKPFGKDALLAVVARFVWTPTTPPTVPTS